LLQPIQGELPAAARHYQIQVKTQGEEKLALFLDMPGVVLGAPTRMKIQVEVVLTKPRQGHRMA
jgi:hypothetical protein